MLFFCLIGHYLCLIGIKSESGPIKLCAFGIKVGHCFSASGGVGLEESPEMRMYGYLKTTRAYVIINQKEAGCRGRI